MRRTHRPRGRLRERAAQTGGRWSACPPAMLLTLPLSPSTAAVAFQPRASIGGSGAELWPLPGPRVDRPLAAPIKTPIGDQTCRPPARRRNTGWGAGRQRRRPCPVTSRTHSQSPLLPTVTRTASLSTIGSHSDAFGLTMCLQMAQYFRGKIFGPPLGRGQWIHSGFTVRGFDGVSAVLTSSSDRFCG